MGLAAKELSLVLKQSEASQIGVEYTNVKLVVWLSASFFFSSLPGLLVHC